MSPSRYSENTEYIQRVMNAAAIKGMMDDGRWPYIMAIVERMLENARQRGTNARRKPSFDSAFQASHFEGQVVFGESLLRTFTTMYDTADRVLDEARDKLPYAPVPPDKAKAQEAPKGTTSEDSHE